MNAACAEIMRQVVAVVQAREWRYTNEDELQESLATILCDLGFDAKREQPLGGAGTIDILIGRVGVEVKVGQSIATVIRQLARYAKSGLVDGLVLVTNRAGHRHVPQSIGDVPIVVVLAGVGL